MLNFYLELASDWQLLVERGEIAREYLRHLRSQVITDHPEVSEAEKDLPDYEGFRAFITGVS